MTNIVVPCVFCFCCGDDVAVNDAGVVETLKAATMATLLCRSCFRLSWYSTRTCVSDAVVLWGAPCPPSEGLDFRLLLKLCFSCLLAVLVLWFRGHFLVIAVRCMPRACNGEGAQGLRGGTRPHTRQLRKTFAAHTQMCNAHRSFSSAGAVSYFARVERF